MTSGWKVFLNKTQKAQIVKENLVITLKSCRTSCDKISYTILRQEVAWEQILAKELLSRIFKTTNK